MARTTALAFDTRVRQTLVSDNLDPTVLGQRTTRRCLRRPLGRRDTPFPVGRASTARPHAARAQGPGARRRQQRHAAPAPTADPRPAGRVGAARGCRDAVKCGHGLQHTTGRQRAALRVAGCRVGAADHGTRLSSRGHAAPAKLAGTPSVRMPGTGSAELAASLRARGALPTATMRPGLACRARARTPTASFAVV
jgi:hypothetical protein